MKHKYFIAAGLLSVIMLSAVSVCAAEDRIRVAFPDSGISLKHLDSKNVAVGENFVFPNSDTDDRIGHGTSTAGIVIGSEELGISGICPSAEVVPLVCFDTYPTGMTAPADAETIAEAIRKAVDVYDCKIINISLGTTQDVPKLKEAVKYAQNKGVLLVSAVGNENENDPSRIYYPAAYEGVIGVGAADANGFETAKFSQRNNVDVVAPGVNLVTVTNRNAAKAEVRSGTSYACAYVSGLCADIWSREPNLTAYEVWHKLRMSAVDIGEVGFDADSGWGFVSSKTVDTPEGRFSFLDIADCNEASSIEICVSRGIFKGSGGGKFEPYTKLSRGMCVTLLYRMAGMPDVEGKDSFYDVDNDSWCFDGVMWALANNVTKGYGDRLFGTENLLTYEQALTMLYRLAVKEEGDIQNSEKLPDDVSDYAKSAYSWALHNGVLKNENEFPPQTACPRAHFAEILNRYMQKWK